MSERIDYIKTDAIGPNPNNPRKHFGTEELKKLAQSIREVGVLQPVLATIANTGESTYRLVAGERRWRAAQLAGLEYIPVVLKKLTPEQEAEIMLIENLQRQNLDPIEEARAYRVLLDKHDYTQEALGEKLGVSQAHIANRLRLLELSGSVQENISREIISPSHGRVLVGYKHLPASVIEKTVDIIIEKQIPVTKTKETLLKTVADIGKPLFDDYNSKPEFKTEPCEGCESRVMGRQYSCAETEYPYCVKPSCWEKKQQEVKQERERVLADRMQKAAQKDGVVDLKKISYGQYEEFYDYKTKGLNLSECQDCQYKKVAKTYSGDLMEVCFKPSCFKKKQAAATREKNKQARDALQVELEEVAELAKSKAKVWMNVLMPRPVLVYLAAQILANIQNNNDRGKTRYQYIKEKLGWDSDFFKHSAHHSLVSEWDAFRGLMESLTEQQLWEIIFEWPAVAEGLTGIRKWILDQVFAEPEILDPDLDPDPKIKSLVFSTEPTAAAYIHDGKEIFVSAGLNLNQFGTFWRSNSGGLHRVQAPAMPMVGTAEEAQRNLDDWAEKKGLSTAVTAT